jgi:glutathione S-transferase
MDWQQTTLNPAGRDAFMQWIRTPATQRNDALIQRSVAATEALLALLDAHLAHQPFMAGEHFTMADIPMGCEIHRWWGLPQERTARPHLERWYQALRRAPRRTRRAGPAADLSRSFLPRTPHAPTPFQTDRRIHRHALPSATRWPWCWTAQA